jgi:hypothetical protein
MYSFLSFLHSSSRFRKADLLDCDRQSQFHHHWYEVAENDVHDSHSHKSASVVVGQVSKLIFQSFLLLHQCIRSSSHTQSFYCKSICVRCGSQFHNEWGSLAVQCSMNISVHLTHSITLQQFLSSRCRLHISTFRLPAPTSFFLIYCIACLHFILIIVLNILKIKIIATKGSQSMVVVNRFLNLSTSILILLSTFAAFIPRHGHSTIKYNNDMTDCLYDNTMMMRMMTTF